MSDIDYPSLIEPVARHFWGDPTKGLTTSIGMRFGSNGPKATVLKEGTWYDHEQHDGGGVLKLILREVEGIDTEGDAVRWLEENHFIAASRPQDTRHETATPEGPFEQDSPPTPDSDEGKMVAVKGYHY